MKWLILIHLLFIGISGSEKTLTDESSLSYYRHQNQWWEIEKVNDKIHSKVEYNTVILLRKVDLDNRNVHSCYEYKVFLNETIVKSNTFCYPSIIITGYQKCSTSALYVLLSQYPHSVPTTGSKENCPFDGGHTMRPLPQYFDTLPRKVEVDEVIIDGCLNLADNMLMRSILREPNTFYLVTVRDYADWLWSAYNYWCDEQFDGSCDKKTGWVTVGQQKRSPAQFHTLLTQPIEMSTLPAIRNYCTKASALFHNFTHTLWTHVKPGNTLIIASEELDVRPEHTWGRIAKTIGLDKKHPRLKEFGSVRYNTNGDKGVFAPEKKSAMTPGLYAASKYKPVLNESRAILNKCWFNDCMFASLVTGHSYPTCTTTHSATNNNKVNNQVSVVAEQMHTTIMQQSRTVFTDSLTVQYLNSRHNHTVFLQQESHGRCKTNYIHIAANHTTVNTQQTQNQKQQFVSSNYSTAQHENVLIITMSKLNRQFMHSLLLFRPEIRHVYQLDSVASDVLCSKNNYVMIAAPADVKLVATNNNKNAAGVVPSLELIKNPCSSVHTHTTAEKKLQFSKYILIIDDSADLIMATWKSYQYIAQFIKESKRSETRYNYTHWEMNAVKILRGNDVYREGRLIVWNEQESAMINTLLQHSGSKGQVMIRRIEQIRYMKVPEYVGISNAVTQFIMSSSSSSSSNSVTSSSVFNSVHIGSDNDKIAGNSIQTTSDVDINSLTNTEAIALALHNVSGATRDRLHCEHLVCIVDATVFVRPAFKIDKTVITHAYSSPDLLCRVRELLRDKPFHLATLLPMYNDTCT